MCCVSHMRLNCQEYQCVRKVRMQLNEPYCWFFIRVGDDFALQYTGDEVNKEFPDDLDGNLSIELAIISSG